MTEYWKYKIEGVSVNRSTLVQVASVLVPVCGPVQSKQDIADHTRRLMAAWRRRVKEFQDRHWRTDHPQYAARRYDFLANCRPAFCWVKPAGRPCRLRTLCPFCWARQVGDLYQAVDSAFFDDAPTPASKKAARRNLQLPGVERKKREPRRSHLDLFEIHWTGQYGKSVELDGEYVDGMKHFLNRWSAPAPRKGASSPEYARCWFLPETPVLGAVQTVRFVPSKRFPDRWRVTVRTLAAVEPGAKVRIFNLETPVRYQRIERPTRMAVLKSVAAACRYPRGLLTGDPLDALQYLDGRRGRRLWTTTGCFRGRRPKPDKKGSA